MREQTPSLDTFREGFTLYAELDNLEAPVRHGKLIISPS